MIEKLDLNTLSDVILEIDTKGAIIDVNDSIDAIFGYAPNEIIGQPITLLMPERYRTNHSNLFEGYSKNPTSRHMGDLTSGNFVGLDKQGNEFYIDIALSVKHNGEKPKSFIAIIRDITDLISLNKQMASNIAELESKNKELEQMAYVISHDLKAPTRAVAGLISFILEDHMESLNPEVADYFAQIQKRNLRMSDLIDGILSYSRAGKIAVDINKIDLSELINEVIDSLHIPVGFKVKLTTRNLTFFANKTQLLQVLSNLIGNGIKYHHKNQGLIEISALQTLDEVEITVKDDGPGIPEKYHSTIFEMFGTANEEGRTDSTGIGLAIVKKIVTQNNGEITLNSEVGRGSEFTFTFKTKTNET